MDIRKIKTLIEMLEESNLNEIEVSQGDESVRISKGKDPLDYIENNQINTSISSQEKVSKNEDETRKFVGNQVKAPLVGTFYRKPSPDSDPFVKVGDIVKKGQVLCIIEAMKIMNEIKSEFDGEVSSIEIEDGQPVEFGQTIIVIQ
ncbi:MAG: acetyl-CoA carboxylase, biotin carboxyl carrier protein [Rhodobacteraceae bacterium]|nr:acetyl-CoA carboxylase, biotin carboxyl carrier protein [Paracoccaceae bacterium]